MEPHRVAVAHHRDEVGDGALDRLVLADPGGPVQAAEQLNAEYELIQASAAMVAEETDQAATASFRMADGAETAAAAIREEEEATRLAAEAADESGGGSLKNTPGNETRCLDNRSGRAYSDKTSCLDSSGRWHVNSEI